MEHQCLNVAPLTIKANRGGLGGTRRLDWEKIERQYRVGRLSIAEIAADVGCTKGAIGNRAKRYGWTRDVTAKGNSIARARLLSEREPASVNDLTEARASAVTAVSKRHLSQIRVAGEVLDAL